MAKKKVVLCDTNVLIRFFAGDESIKQELIGIGTERLALSAISEVELYAGMRKGEKTRTTQAINYFDIVDLDKEISRRFTRLAWSHYKLKPAIPDLLIAATALVYQCELFTFNKKDFDFIEGIQFFKPTYQHVPYR